MNCLYYIFNAVSFFSTPYFLLILIFFFLVVGKYTMTKKMILASMLSWMISYGIKFITKIPRPEGMVMYVPFTSIMDYSFPSSHTMVSFAIAVVVANSLEPTGKKKMAAEIFIYSAALLVGLSRIYFGYHRIIDVMVGGILGIFVGMLLGPARI